jgi:hypothetical protein
MKSSSDKLDLALGILRGHGHVVDTNQTAIGPTGKVLIPVDGIMRPHNEIYAMAGFRLEPE